MKDFTKTLDSQAEQVRQRQSQARRRLTWCPAKVHPDGTVENIIQGTIERKGPQRGHWAQVRGKRVWIEGQHNYNRQHNPQNQQENILGTRLMNTNSKMIPLRDDNGNFINTLDIDAKVLRYSVMKPVSDVMHDDIFSKSINHAQLYLSRNNVQASAPDSQMKKAGIDKRGASESLGLNSSRRAAQ